MRLPLVRFTVRRIMALVSLVAVGLALLRHALGHWGPGEVEVLALTMLLATNVLAWFQRARWQLFWIGFGVSGLAYLTISLGSPLAEKLPTARLLNGLHDRLYAGRAVPVGDDDFANSALSPRVHGAAFRRAGQSVLSLLFGILGGAAAIALFPAPLEEEVPLPPDRSLLKPGWREEPRDAHG